MGFFAKLAGIRNQRSLASLKRRATVGARITLLTTNLKGTDRPMPNELQGVPRVIRSVHSDHVRFDPYGVGGERTANLYWPGEPQEGFLGILIAPHGALAGFIDDNTFIIDDMCVSYSVYRIDN